MRGARTYTFTYVDNEMLSLARLSTISLEGTTQCVFYGTYVSDLDRSTLLQCFATQSAVVCPHETTISDQSFLERRKNAGEALNLS